MSKNNRSHEEFIATLKDEKVADAYFYATLEECKKMDSKEAQEHLVSALRNLSAAHGTIAHFLNKIGIMKYDTFYNTLSSVILKIAG